MRDGCRKKPKNRCKNQSESKKDWKRKSGAKEKKVRSKVESDRFAIWLLFTVHRFCCVYLQSSVFLYFFLSTHSLVISARSRNINGC